MIREITNIKKDVASLLDMYESTRDKYQLDYRIMGDDKSVIMAYDKEFNYQYKKRYNKKFNPNDFNQLLDLEKMSNEEKLLRLLDE